MSDVKSEFAGHPLDNLHVDGGIVRFIVNGEQGNASFMLSDDSIGRNDAGTASLAAALGSDGHTNLGMPG